MIIQFCGLSGSGKTTLAVKTKEYFKKKNIEIEIIDGDEYRKNLCQDLGYSKKDRNTNIRRLAFVAGKLSEYQVVPIICAINPYDDVRKELTIRYSKVKTIFIKCSFNELLKRDTKGLYKKAMLPDDHPDKIRNLSGVNDPFETPAEPDLIIDTENDTVENSVKKLTDFIQRHISR